ncbi:hypothetical protein NEIPOLOT_02261 [Neisseria polysaccharea ATCC 43768]|nr:hypothetical protein NEIPOLOT_02261 [Neisseria polysaccharea ATCC 43768]
MQRGLSKSGCRRQQSCQKDIAHIPYIHLHPHCRHIGFQTAFYSGFR